MGSQVPSSHIPASKVTLASQQLERELKREGRLLQGWYKRMADGNFESYALSVEEIEDPFSIPAAQHPGLGWTMASVFLWPLYLASLTGSASFNRSGCKSRACPARDNCSCCFCPASVKDAPEKLGPGYMTPTFLKGKI